MSADSRTGRRTDSKDKSEFAKSSATMKKNATNPMKVFFIPEQRSSSSAMEMPYQGSKFKLDKGYAVKRIKTGSRSVMKADSGAASTDTDGR